MVVDAGPARVNNMRNPVRAVVAVFENDQSGGPLMLAEHNIDITVVVHVSSIETQAATNIGNYRVLYPVLGRIIWRLQPDQFRVIS